MANMFDSPWKVLIIALVILVLFGSRKLPDAARSLGRSMRILKKEINELHEEETPKPAAATPAVTAPQAQPQLTQQGQVEELQRQIDELRRQSAAAEVQQTHQAS